MNNGKSATTVASSVSARTDRKNASAPKYDGLTNPFRPHLNPHAREVVCQLRAQGGLGTAIANEIECGRAQVDGDRIINPVDGSVLAEREPEIQRNCQGLAMLEAEAMTDESARESALQQIDRAGRSVLNSLISREIADALHRLIGHPVIAAGDSEDDPLVFGVLLPDGRVLDATGVSGEDEWRERWACESCVVKVYPEGLGEKPAYRQRFESLGLDPEDWLPPSPSVWPELAAAHLIAQFGLTSRS